MKLKELEAKGEVEAVIDDFGHRGEGFVRLEDGWLSVPGALPGEHVRVRVSEGVDAGSRRVFGELLEVMRPSEERHDPHCDRDRSCFGCQLRHITPASELSFKVRQVREVVEKFAGVPVDRQPHVNVIAPRPFPRGEGFRVRTSLAYRRRGEDWDLGLSTPRREELVRMSSCPALTEPAQRIVGFVEQSFDAVEQVPFDRYQQAQARERGEPFLSDIHVAAPVFGHGFVDFRLRRSASGQQMDDVLAEGTFAQIVDILDASLPASVGLAVRLDTTREYVRGPRRIRLPVAGLTMEVGYDDWFHATMAPAEALYDALTTDVLDLDEAGRMLDVGCGIGTISLLAAPLAEEVVGFDINPGSIEAAEISAAANDIFNVRFFCAGWEKGLRKLALDEEIFETVTINPMREPIGRRALSYVPRLGAETVAYLGPSPASAARDLAELCDLGYELDYLAAANLHPATYHAMLVARLVRA